MGGAPGAITEATPRERRLEAQYETTQILAESASIRQAAPRVLAAVCRSLDWSVGQVWGVDEERNVLSLVEAWHEASEALEGFVEANRELTFEQGVGLPGRVWASGRPAWIVDVLADDNFPRRRVARDAGLRAGVAAPIAVLGEVIGVLELFGSEIREPDEDELRMIVSIGRQIGQFVNRIRAELGLRDSRDELEAILRSVREGILVERRGGRFAFANEAAARLLGRASVDELLETSVRDAFGRFEITDEQGHEVRLDKLPGKRARRGRSAPERLLKLRDRDTGEERWLLIESTAISEVGSGRSDLSVTVMREVTGRQRAQQAQRFLAEAAEILGSSLNYQRTLQQIAALVVPGLADLCAVETVQADGTIVLEALAHVEPEKAAVMRRLREEHPLDPRQPFGVPQVVRSGRSELYTDVDDELLRGWAQDEDVLALLRELEPRSAMIVPMTSRGRVIGTISTVASGSGRRFMTEDLALAEELAGRAAVAVDNAQLYEARSQLAQTLQRSLLPVSLPAIPWAEVAARYHAGGDGVEVGGDFYDVFPVDAASWGVVLGDVCGKGAGAAAITALARYSVRTAALSVRRPGPVLSLLNEAIIGQLGEEASFFTAVYALLIRQEHGVRLSLARAGHPQPFVLRATGEVEPVGAPGPLLGVFPQLEAPEKSRVLGPGDALVLYTDGLLGLGLEEEDLQRLLEGCAGLGAEEIANRLEQVANGPPDGRRDDVALLVMRISGS